MSDQDNSGGDRTVFDPLSADELKALREARQKLRGGSGQRPPVGPDSGDDIGDAPTRAMKAIPSTDSGGVTLESIDTKPKVMPDPRPMQPQSQPAPQPDPTPQQPMSVNMTVPANHQSQPSAAPGPGPQAGAEPKVGEPGFGENTLMWMQPVKPAEAQVIPERGAAAAAGMTPTAVVQDTAGRKLMLGVVGVMGLATLVILGFLLFGGGGGQKVPVELITDPRGATVRIDNKDIGDVKTPMKAELRSGPHVIEYSLEGYRTETVTIDVKGEDSMREELTLFPLSKDGLKTVSISVAPIAANIELDGKVVDTKRLVRVANVDPSKEHKLVIQAGGFEKIEKVIKKGQLRDEYNFLLEAVKDEE